jgi:hypothetical protein
VIYLGAGWALTAQHVGIGEIFLEGEVFAPIRRSRHTLLNVDGTPADAIVFQIYPNGDGDIPDLPILPLASVAPLPGEEVMLVGFGRGRGKVIEWQQDGVVRFGFEWSEKGSKRWGTNRIKSNQAMLVQENLSTHALTFIFDRPHSENSTRHEAHAATGDSGGAVFVWRDGQWQLAGMMTSVSANTVVPRHKTTAAYDDITFAADISFYRDEILRWARPKCANEEDDDGDGKIDFPLDPGCRSPADSDERDIGPTTNDAWNVGAITLTAACIVGVVMFLRLRNSDRSGRDPR